MDNFHQLVSALLLIALKIWSNIFGMARSLLISFNICQIITNGPIEVEVKV